MADAFCIIILGCEIGPTAVGPFDTTDEATEYARETLVKKNRFELTNLRLAAMNKP